MAENCPKFANLPGIAYDQPDYYYSNFDETSDAPNERTSNNYEDTEAECIERLHFSDDSNNKFKGKYLTGHIDYSHHDVRGGCWELAAQGEKETPIEKYRRIKCEMDELMDEIVDLNANASVSKKDKESYEAVSQAVNCAQKVLGSLKLDNVFGSETVSTASENEIKKLLAQIDRFRKNDAIQTSAEKSKNQLEYTKRIAELEARLHYVETIIGTPSLEKLNRLAGTFFDSNDTLLDAVQQISTKAALLQSSQLDDVASKHKVIESRISGLTSKLNEKAEVISEKKGTNVDSIDGLYDITKTVEPIAKFLPSMLKRMQALQTLHIQANNFNKTISRLESTQSALVLNLNGNKSLLREVQETFALNLENVNQEIAKLETRLKDSEKSQS